MLKDSDSGYGIFSILLHWISALLIIFLFASGFYMVGLGYYDTWYHRLPSLHISVGLVLLLLTVARIIWRFCNAKPQPLPNYSRTTRLLAAAMKYLLYVFVLVVIVTGYLVTSAEGKPASLFGLLDFPIIAQLGPDGVDRAGQIHELVAWAIVVFAGIHAGAALMHHFVIRDRTLMRMLKPVKKIRTGNALSE